MIIKVKKSPVNRENTKKFKFSENFTQREFYNIKSVLESEGKIKRHRKTDNFFKSLGVDTKNRSGHTLDFEYVIVFLLAKRKNTRLQSELHEEFIKRYNLIEYYTNPSEKLLPFDKKTFIHNDEWIKGYKRDLDKYITGKQIKDFVLKCIKRLIESGVIEGLGIALGDGEYTKTLAINQQAYDTLILKYGKLINNSLLIKKRNLKRPYNPKPSATADNDNFFTFGSYSQANSTNCQKLYSSKKQLKQDNNDYIIFKLKRNKEKIYSLTNEYNFKKSFHNQLQINKANIGKLIDHWKSIKELYKNDEQYQKLIFKTNHQDCLIFKNKKLQGFVRMISSNIGKLTNPEFLKLYNHNRCDNIAYYITWTNQLINDLMVELNQVMKEREAKMKHYNKIEDRHYYYYLQELKKLRNNLGFLLNKMCGLYNIEERRKLYWLIVKNYSTDGNKLLYNRKKSIITEYFDRRKCKDDFRKVMIFSFDEEKNSNIELKTKNGLIVLTKEQEKFEKIIQNLHNYLFVSFVERTLPTSAIMIIKKHSRENNIDFELLKANILLKSKGTNLGDALIEIFEPEKKKPSKYEIEISENLKKEEIKIQAEKEFLKNIKNSDRKIFELCNSAVVTSSKGKEILNNILEEILPRRINVNQEISRFLHYKITKHYQGFEFDVIENILVDLTISVKKIANSNSCQCFARKRYSHPELVGIFETDAEFAEIVSSEIASFYNQK